MSEKIENMLESFFVCASAGAIVLLYMSSQDDTILSTAHLILMLGIGFTGASISALWFDLKKDVKKLKDDVKKKEEAEKPDF